MKRFVFILVILIMTNYMVSGQDINPDSLITSNTNKTTEPNSVKVKRILTEKEFRIEYRNVLKQIELFTYKSNKYCSNIRDIWHSAIFDDYYKYNGKTVKDFNEALSLYDADRLKNEDYRNYIIFSADKIKNTIKAINQYPPQYENAFNELLQLGILAEELYDCATTPTGSYNSYSTTTTELYKQIKRKLYELEMKYTD